MLEMCPERWSRLTKIQKIVWNMAERFRNYRCHGNIKNLASRDKCPHVVIHMLSGQRVSLTYFAKRREVQVFDQYNNLRADQNIWVFKEWQDAVDFVIRGLDGYSKVIEHRVRSGETGSSKTLIHRKHKQKPAEKCHH